MISYLDKIASKLRKPMSVAIALLFVFILTEIDILTGEELSFSLFYLAPILWLTWYVGKRAGVFAAIAASIAWLAADYLSGHQYSHTLIPFWNCAIRMGFFLLSVIMLSTIRSKLDTEQHNADFDSLTNLANSRLFYEVLQTESYRSKRYRHPFTIIYIDLDGFKQVNDTFGHFVGDDVLREVASAIRNGSRQSDTIARIGGDEFIALFPETDFPSASIVINNIHDLISEVAKKSGWPITSSVGAVTYLEPLEQLSDMVKATDDLMYQVKKSGKNSVLHRQWKRQV